MIWRLNRETDAYYRLKQVDVNGHYKYSPIISVSIDLNEILIFPNPTTGAFAVNFGTNSDSSCSIKIRNILGELIYFSKRENQSSSIMIDVNFPVGIYLVSIYVNEKEMLKRITIID